MRLLTAQEVAEELQVPVSWVYAAARAGTFPAVRCGRYVRFATEDVAAWVNRQRAPANGARW